MQYLSVISVLSERAEKTKGTNYVIFNLMFCY